MTITITAHRVTKLTPTDTIYMVLECYITGKPNREIARLANYGQGSVCVEMKE